MGKLFAGLASALAVLALIARGRRIAPFDVYLHDGYHVIAPSEFLFSTALIAGILAFLYFAVSRWKFRPPNQLVGFLSFAILLVSLLTWFTAAFFVRNDSPPHYTQLYALFGALNGFLFGLVLLVANFAWTFAWTMLSKVRSRLSPH